MKTIVSLFLLAMACLFNATTAAEEKDSVSKVARNTSAEKTLPEPKDKAAKFKIEIIPLCSPSGIPRKTAYVPGETLTFSAQVTLTDPKAKQDFDYTTLKELYDPNGNLVMQLPENRFDRKSMQFGGTAFRETFWFGPEDPKPGKYRVAYLVIDRATGKSEAAECAFEIAGKDTFAALNIYFSSVTDRAAPCSGNFVVGEPKYLIFWVNGAAVKENRIHLKCTLTVLDSKRRPIDAEPRNIDAYNPAPHSLRDNSNLYFTVFPNSRPGDFVLRLEIADCIGEKTISYELPIKVLPPAGIED